MPLPRVATTVSLITLNRRTCPGEVGGGKGRCIDRVTMGHFRATIGEHRVTVGHLRVTSGHLRISIGHP